MRKSTDGAWENIRKTFIKPIIKYDKDNKLVKNFFKKMQIN